MTLKQNSSLGIVFILGLLAMLMPLSIDMYLPALPVIAAQYNVCLLYTSPSPRDTR